MQGRLLAISYCCKALHRWCLGVLDTPQNPADSLMTDELTSIKKVKKAFYFFIFNAIVINIKVNGKYFWLYGEYVIYKTTASIE